MVRSTCVYGKKYFRIFLSSTNLESYFGHWSEGVGRGKLTLFLLSVWLTFLSINLGIWSKTERFSDTYNCFILLELHCRLTSQAGRTDCACWQQRSVKLFQLEEGKMALLVFWYSCKCKIILVFIWIVSFVWTLNSCQTSFCLHHLWAFYILFWATCKLLLKRTCCASPCFCFFFTHIYRYNVWLPCLSMSRSEIMRFGICGSSLSGQPICLWRLAWKLFFQTLAHLCVTICRNTLLG